MTERWPWLLWLCLAACTGDTGGHPADAPTLSFAALGDAPYSGLDFPRYRKVLRQIDAQDPAVLIHVGDILWHPCDETTYRSRLEGWQALDTAVIYTPGDNEWADCHDRKAGEFAPLERLETIRRIFFADPATSLGRRTLRLDSQAATGGYPAYVENARWQIDGVVFATFHMPGSWNAGSIFPGRTDDDDTAALERTLAAAAWLETTFAVAKASGARALVLATHADMSLSAPVDDPYRSVYEPFVQRLEELAAGSEAPVLLIHGDGHDYTVDRPLRDRRTGQPIANLTRLQVMGSPDIGWVEIGVTGDGRFVFEPHRIPWWVLR